MQNEANPITGQSGPPPGGPAALARRAGRVLSETGYNQDSIAELLGPANAGKPAPDLRDQWLWRTRSADPLSTFVRLFAMGEPVANEAAARAFRPLTIDQFAALRLIRIQGARVRPAVQLIAESNLILASDLHAQRGAPLAE